MAGSTEEETVAVDYHTNSTRFSVHDAKQLQQGVEHLDEYGYAVFSNILSDDEVTKSVDLLWKYLEGLKRPYHIQRNDPETWNGPWPGMAYIGLLKGLGIGQSEFLWYIRGNPNVKKVFSQIWNSNELFVSFDGAGCFRDWHLNTSWKTFGGWYHCDQNPFKKPNRCSIQGLVSLTDTDESTGGLVVVPYSHRHFLDLKSAVPEKRDCGDFIRTPYQYPLLKKSSPRLVKCQAGDLVVWDSRCIHCNSPALIDQEKTNRAELLRIVAYICMSPLSMFVPVPNKFKNLEEFRRLRESLVRDRASCTHWPLELIHGDEKIMPEEMPLKLNTYQHSLIVGTNIEPENGTEEIEF